MRKQWHLNALVFVTVGLVPAMFQLTAGTREQVEPGTSSGAKQTDEHLPIEKTNCVRCHLTAGRELTVPVRDFARSVHSPTRRDTLRLKDWLHLSLAYAFPPEQHESLAKLARELVDMRAPVAWELSFYERDLEGAWIAHADWPL